MVYKGTNRQIDKLQNYLNGINNKIQFTLENEVRGQLHFLDLTVTKNIVTKKLRYNIFRNPTMTDAVSYTHLDVYKRQGKHSLKLFYHLPQRRTLITPYTITLTTKYHHQHNI